MFVIYLNQMQGVDLITRALRKTTCIASHDLAEGIEKNLHFVNEEGIIQPCSLGPKRPTLKLIGKEITNEP